MKELKQSLWSQFGASIDMLLQAIEACPEDMYRVNQRFYFTAYHVTIFLDYYLTIPPSDFDPTLPFTSVDTNEIPSEALDDVLPNKHYHKEQLIGYVISCKQKCLALIMSLEEDESRRFIEDVEVGKMDYSLLEILLYNLRHVQHHTAQLNQMLRGAGIAPPKWIARVIQ